MESRIRIWVGIWRVGLRLRKKVFKETVPEPESNLLLVLAMKWKKLQQQVRAIIVMIENKNNKAKFFYFPNELAKLLVELLELYLQVS